MPDAGHGAIVPVRRARWRKQQSDRDALHDTQSATTIGALRKVKLEDDVFFQFHLVLYSCGAGERRTAPAHGPGQHSAICGGRYGMTVELAAFHACQSNQSDSFC